MSYRLNVLPSATKAMRRMPAAVCRRIDRPISALADNPRPNGYLKLAGYPNAYRIRVGSYRFT